MKFVSKVVSAVLFSLMFSLPSVAANVKQSTLIINFDSEIAEDALTRTQYNHSTNADWTTIPALEIATGAPASNSVITSTNTNYWDGTVTYGVADFCSSNCLPAYTFTITLDWETCKIDKSELGLGTDREYRIQHSFNTDPNDATRGICTINIGPNDGNPPVTPLTTNLQIANLSNDNGQVGGHLENGTVRVNSTTLCNATNPDPISCAEAGQQAIIPGDVGPLFTFFNADAPNMGAAVIYQINDPALPAGETYRLEVYIQNASQVIDRCKAAITPTPPETGIRYSASVEQVGDPDNNTCQVNLNRLVNVQPGSPQINVVISNQPDLEPGQGDFSYGLISGQTETTRGQFTVLNPQDIPVDEIASPATTLTAFSGSTDYYQGEVTYLFDDYGFNSRLQVVLNSQASSICVPYINNFPDTEQEYAIASVTITDDPSPANSKTCTIVIGREVPPEPPVDTPQISVYIQNFANQDEPVSGYTFNLVDGTTELASEDSGFFDPEDISDVIVPANMTTTYITLLSALDDPESDYNGNIYYTFEDDAYENGEAVNGLQITLNSAATNICQPQITGPNNGLLIYDYERPVQLLPDPSNPHHFLCSVKVTSRLNPNPPLPEYQFVNFSTVPSTGNVAWEHFYMPTTQMDYLVGANPGKTNYTPGTDFNVYSLANGSGSFGNLQFLGGTACILNGDPTHLANYPYNWMYFEVGDGVPRIAMVNHQQYTTTGTSDCLTPITYNTTASIYQWNSGAGRFNTTGNIVNYTADSPTMAEFYQINGTSYMAVAQGYKAGQSVAGIYAWNSITFNPMSQPAMSVLGTVPVSSIKHFVDPANGQDYLIFTRSGAGAEVLVFKVDGSGVLTLHQSSTLSPEYPIATSGYVNQALAFTVNNEVYMAVGFVAGQTIPEVYIYKWDETTNGSFFIPHQTLPANTFQNVQAWEHFKSPDGSDFLAAAFGTGGAYAYYWNAGAEEMEYEAPYTIWSAGDNIVNLTAFTTQNGTGDVMMALSRNNGVSSPIQKWQSISNQ